MRRRAHFAVLIMFLGFWGASAWGGEKAASRDLGLNLFPQEMGGVWKPAKKASTGWEILPLGVVEIPAQELMAISGGGPLAAPRSGDAPGKIILWDEFRPQNSALGVQTGNYGEASAGTQQNLIMAVGR